MGPTRLLQGRQRTALSANILRLLVGCTLIAGLVLRLKRAWADVPTIILEATPDDAFYYFGIARNIATGHNVTFDGEHLTNGFHPLWAALLTPFYLVTDSSELPIHLGLSMSAVFDVGTILLIFLIVRALTEDEWSALLSSFVYAVHPYFVVQAVNGLETGVSVFMVAIITWLFSAAGAQANTTIRCRIRRAGDRWRLRRPRSNRYYSYPDPGGPLSHDQG